MSSTRSSQLLSSSSSFDYLSSNVDSREPSDSSESYSTVGDESEDEIVWSFSELSSGVVSPAPRSQRAFSPNPLSEDEYIVLSRPRSPARYQSLTAPATAASRVDTASIDSLSQTFGTLSVRRSRPSRKFSAGNRVPKSPSTTPSECASPPSTPKKRQRKKRVPANQTTPAKPTTPTTQPPQTKKGKKAVVATPSPRLVSKKTEAPKVSKRAKAITTANVDNASEDGFPIVDDVSEVGDAKSGYEEAVQYVTLALTSDLPKKNSDLTLLQALIIELGLCPAPRSFNGLQSESLPRSLRAAKALLKSHVFLNVRDYLAVRHKGLDALREIMHPNRQALIKDIKGGRREGRRVPRDRVKESGLGVFLVTCYP